MSLVYHGFTNITAVFQATWNETVLQKWFQLLKIVKSKHYCACMTAAWVAVSILEILSSWLQSLTLKLNCLKNVPLYLNVIFLIRFEMFWFLFFFYKTTPLVENSTVSDVNYISLLFFFLHNSWHFKIVWLINIRISLKNNNICYMWDVTSFKCHPGAEWSQRKMYNSFLQ